MKPSRIYPADPPMKGSTPACTTERVKLTTDENHNGIEIYDTRIPLKGFGAMEIRWGLER